MIPLAVEVLILGVVFVAASVIGIWLTFLFWRSARENAWRRFARPAPLCPKCRYNLTGRTNTQCPECGATHTLDELWRLQKTIAAPDEQSKRNS